LKLNVTNRFQTLLSISTCATTAWVRVMRAQLALPHVSDVDFSWWGAYSDGGRGLHAPTFQLNVSAFCEIGGVQGVFRGWFREFSGRV